MSNGGCKGDGFTKVSAGLIRGSLATRLAKVADKARDLNTKLGLRQYTVKVIRTQWTGKKRGLGVEEVVSETDILPTPLVIDVGAIAEQLSPFGRNETGALMIEQISHRYTEDFLLGVDPLGRQPGPDEQVYWEVQFYRPDGQPAERRRMRLAQAPFYNPMKLMWTVTLESTNENRQRDGSP